MTTGEQMSVHELEAPVRRVTVMEDRAQVVRCTTVHLPAGRHLVRVERVSPLVVDRTLRARLEGPSDAGVGAGEQQPAGRLVDLGAERSSTVEQTLPGRVQELKEKLDTLERARAAHQHGLDLSGSEHQAISRSRTCLLEHISRQAGRGLDGETAWSAGIERLEQQLEQVEQHCLEGAFEAEDLDDRLIRLGQRLWAAMQPTVHYWAALRAEVEIEREGDYTVAWEYLVPCALWRPSHQAELLQGPEGAADQALRWTTFGTVWQNTGEPWDEIELRLSTERPTLGAELPLLEEDLLRLRPKSDQERRVIEVGSRDEEINVIAPGLDDVRRTSVVPGVDDGGEVRVFTVEDPVTIPPDGRAHLVQVGAFEAETRLDLVCFPELSEAVLLRSQQANAGAVPLLAGPVRLIRDGGFMGRVQVPFVAAAASFALGWGSIDELQVARRTGQHSEETTLSRRTIHKVWTEVYLSNTGRSPQRLTVTERVPVSEIEEVVVKLDREGLTAGYVESSEGHLTWEVTLAAAACQELKLAYSVDAHRKVVWR
jgi:uncharacterized protein (TIGR02231 family)